MDSPNRSFSDVVGLLKSWIPWRSEPVNVSRDFWMPDESCRLCYDCESQFTLFNRRPHCRLCGRVFCSKCTSNWIPMLSSQSNISPEDWDKIRVCNFCFKLWEQGMMVPVENGTQVTQLADLDLSSSSPSAASFISTMSSTCCSSSMTFVSLPKSVGLSSYQSSTSTERQSNAAPINNDHDVGIGEQTLSQDQLNFFPCRSDDEDEEYGSAQLSSRASNYSQVNDYFGSIQFDDIVSDCNSCKAHPDGDTVDSRSMENYPLQSSSNSQADAQQILGKTAEHDISVECDASSSLYVAQDVDLEPVDFENNGVLWFPPEPEDEEDEREALIFEDEDDDDAAAAGDWGYSSISNSLLSGENGSRDKTNEEQKQVMKSVVDGHFRALVSQLLLVENIPAGEENDKESWLEIITSLSWEAATLLKPDMSKSGQMNPGGYVKVKCLASGCRSESVVVKGVVCKKNVAHHRMTSKIEKPRLMILGGALECHRVSNALSSFDTLLQQEMDHLKMAVAKVEAHHPNILLVEKSVSRYAQEYLLAKNITLVLNIKKPLLERIARCTGSQIVPSIDHLSSPKLGHCDKFHVEKFVEEHGSSSSQGGKKLVKTLMYFEGCPKPLGCTILLRGANGDDLKKVKHVVQYGIFAAYHLALETSFLADEGASLPDLPVNTPITVALPDKPSKIDRSISTIPGFTIPENEKTPGPQTIGEPHRSVSVPSAELINLATSSIPVDDYAKTSDLSAPMNSQHTEPLASFSTEGFQHSSLNDHAPWHASEETGFEEFFWSPEAKSLDVERSTVTGDCSSSDFGDSNVKMLHDDFFKSDHNRSVSLPPSFELGDQILEEQPTLKENFQPAPSDHQSILVSLSSRCVWKGTVCERSHLFRIKYYGNFDKPLGRFLRDHLFDQNYRCRSCEMPAEAHVQCYTHRQGTLTISVKKLAEILLPGEKDGKIWMWHRCLKCPRANGFPPATRRVVMSDAAWGLSFGKFLELSFSNHAAASRVASCGHSLHRDCLRFYGFGNMVACFRYASIDVHSVYLPPPKLEFNYESQEWIQREKGEVASRAKLLFSEVLDALHQLVKRKSCSSMASSGTNVHPSAHHLADLEVTLSEEKQEFEGYLQNIVNKEPKKGQPAIDILELNRLRRQLVFRSYVWDHRLIYADSLDNKTLQDDMEVSSPECAQKPAITENLLDLAKTGKSMGSSVSANSKTAKGHRHGLSDQQGSHHVLSLHQRTNSFLASDHARTKTTNESDIVESDRTLRRALSDGQVPFSLSESLDAAWTGENFPSFGITKNNKLSENLDCDKSPTVALSEKLDQEEHGEDLSMCRLPSTGISKNSKNTETVSWLGMPFMSFYTETEPPPGHDPAIVRRSLNKSFLGSSQKLDTLSDYDPVYISSFRESELKSGARLLLPVGVNDIVVPVYDDEPTSIISYVLLSDDYVNQLSDEAERQRDGADSLLPMPSLDSLNVSQSHSFHEMMLESSRSFGPGDEAVLSFTTSRSSLPFPLDPLLHTKALHARESFGVDGPLGQVKYTVTCYFAKRFDALRRMCCPSEVDFVRSLSRCKKWGAQGGKSNVFFAKTLDDRFIIKQVTKTELESFIKFAPGYFKYLSESIASGSPTCLAKILGIYQVASRYQKGGKESKMDFLVMENLLFGRNLSRLYDLKGSSRSRYNPDTSGSNKVLLDQNLIEAMPTCPIFVGNKAKRILERAVWNDTAFLASVDVMDYSLLVGVDEEKNELVLGIIDFMRQYTWDKHLETWVKASGILGGPKNASPTVISPKQYKRRFRKAMTTYFLMVPDQWSPPAAVPTKPQTDLSEDSHSQTTTPAG